jgi:hypothetical protein
MVENAVAGETVKITAIVIGFSNAARSDADNLRNWVEHTFTLLQRFAGCEVVWEPCPAHEAQSADGPCFSATFVNEAGQFNPPFMRIVHTSLRERLTEWSGMLASRDNVAVHVRIACGHEEYTISAPKPGYIAIDRDLIRSNLIVGCIGIRVHKQ